MPVNSDTNQDKIVVVNEETQKRMGLETQSLTATNFPREIKGFGHVIDPAPLVTLAADLASAQIAATGSRQELERAKILSVNTSAKALQLAEANAKRDELTVEMARAKITLNWGKTIAAQENLSAFLQPILAGEKILLRTSLPAGEIFPGKPTGARFTSLAGANPLDAQFLEALPQMDDQTQGQGFLFSARSQEGFPPGAAITGFMQVAGQPLAGIMVPRSAIVRNDGRTWVYLKTGGDHFVRREVKLEIPTNDGWLVSQLATNDVVVVNGAQILLSEESKLNPTSN
ncbi:MAG: hypothetical protein ABJC04_01550 [Verrucomicrobiota bacterium]